MKTKITILVGMFLFGTICLFAQSKSQTFKVYGNCGMCETRIENAAKSVDGVTAADWSTDTKMLVVAFDSTKTDVDKIQTAIAKVGHDTGMHKASEEVYNKLPGCCQYERSEAEHESM